MKAYVGIGLPGSGKTTILKPFAERHRLKYVNRDDIREELTGDPTNHTKEPAVTRLMYERIREGLGGDSEGVVVDATHAKAKDRRTVVNFCRENGAREVIGFWVNVPLETALQRNAGRRRVVREEALRRMQNKFDVNPPSRAEGFDDIIIVTD